MHPHHPQYILWPMFGAISRCVHLAPDCFQEFTYLLLSVVVGTRLLICTVRRRRAAAAMRINKTAWQKLLKLLNYSYIVCVHRTYSHTHTHTHTPHIFYIFLLAIYKCTHMYVYKDITILASYAKIICIVFFLVLRIFWLLACRFYRLLLLFFGEKPVPQHIQYFIKWFLICARASSSLLRTQSPILYSEFIKNKKNYNTHTHTHSHIATLLLHCESCGGGGMAVRWACELSLCDAGYG